MPRFQYIAIAPDGKKDKGTVTAESPYAARKQLRIRGIHPTEIKELSSSAEGGASIFSFLSKTRKTQIIEFTKQMATLLNSGIKLTEALSVLTMQTPDQHFKIALVDIRDRVVSGESLADAMKDYTDYFDVIYVSMVHVGEVTGSLANSFAAIGSFMEKRHRVESKIVTAMIYPIVLIFFCLTAVIVLTSAVIPRITKQLEDAGQQLPLLTRILSGVGYVFTSLWIFVLIAAVVVVVISLRRFLKTERGSYLRDKLLLSLPVFGPIIRQRVVARFASTLSTLLSSGLSIAESLRVVAEVTGNSIMKKAVQKARERILAGADIATPLRDSGVIDPAIAHMVTVGEKSGELETMLKNISENLESSTDVVIERLAILVEPIIIIIMAVVIGLIAVAVLLPILKISTQQS
jgi:type II secretory pathway component PulF